MTSYEDNMRTQTDVAYIILVFVQMLNIMLEPNWNAFLEPVANHNIGHWSLAIQGLFEN